MTQKEAHKVINVNLEVYLKERGNWKESNKQECVILKEIFKEEQLEHAAKVYGFGERERGGLRRGQWGEGEGGKRERGEREREEEKVSEREGGRERERVVIYHEEK